MIKVMLQREKKHLEQQNQARAMVGLPLILIKVRKCHTCSGSFESAGNFYCKKCNSPKVQTISNHPIL